MFNFKSNFYQQVRDDKNLRSSAYGSIKKLHKSIKGLALACAYLPINSKFSR